MVEAREHPDGGSVECVRTMERKLVDTDRFIQASEGRASPALSFAGETEADFATWKKKLSQKLRELAGPMPPPADLSPRVMDSVDTGEFVRHKVLLQTEEDCWMPTYLLVPKSASQQSPAPAILCCHGHGAYGKDSVAGVLRKDPPRNAEIEHYNYDYAAQMARRGYVTIAPDWRSFGERVGYGRDLGGRDICNLHFLQELLRGRVLLTLNVFDAMRAIDYVQSRLEVDPQRIGCMGLSQGGTMTTFVTAMDQRIRAADIICYVTPWRHFAYERHNFCGSQIIPGLYHYADVPDVAGLIAPRPLLMEAGLYDDCFEYRAVKQGHKQVKRIYRAAGCADRLHIEVFPGAHAFAGGKAFEFFDTYLKA